MSTLIIKTRKTIAHKQRIKIYILFFNNKSQNLNSFSPGIVFANL